MRIRNAFLLCIAAVGLSGCAAFEHLMCTPNCGSTDRTSSSLVEFLYPNGATPPVENSVPQLRVPLRVGLAFLPERAGFEPLPAANKQELLERIRARFKDRKFVSEIVLVPDYYLKDAKGFAGLEGVQRLYNIDVMALVSYDQVTHRDDNQLSLGYLTIVGAYVLKGSRHDTTTLVDLAVIDPATRSLVLRAGGVDSRRANTTLIERDAAARATGVESFNAATDQVIVNFDAALTAFEADVRAGKANVRVAQRNAEGKGGGGGAFGWCGALALAGLLGIRFTAART